ncbi:flavin reductase family protein [Falsirhodobacter sp. alg1]|uniref:flavin reductase family protein n=1 Tax=Falsirhodobacter sp. alg1 TaxID=1472418 RepID=UPI0005EE7833|nr:flavin reductase family protein [Falsirhodobacter sp. alg1]
MTTFQAGENAISLRDALGKFATGVTLVSTMTEQGPVGMVANSFASVSLDPPLVLWSPARSSSRFHHFERARHFAIHVLAQDQTHVSSAFGRNGPGFDGLPHELSEGGAPLLEGTLARFECDTHATHDGGDHLIIVGRVGRVTVGAGEPLIFSQGRFGGFTA